MGVTEKDQELERFSLSKQLNHHVQPEGGRSEIVELMFWCPYARFIVCRV